jgi:hypothetical protein
VARTNRSGWTTIPSPWDEDDRNVIHERIANGELPADFTLTEHRHYVGARARHRYLEPEPMEEE